MLLRVERSRAEEVKNRLVELGLLDPLRKVDRRGDSIEFAILGPVPPGLGMVIEGEAGMRTDIQVPPYRRILEAAQVPPALKPFVPDKWEKYGKVVLLKLPKKLLGYKKDIARAYASVLGAETVLLDASGSRGALREPTTELLLGQRTETTHVENGIRYCFDAARLMFSSGNMAERIRMGKAVERSETVVDMFAGIGYFTLPMAVHGRPERIYACELNPASHRYLERNIRLNKVADRVVPLLGDCRVVAPEGVADRAVLGHFDSPRFVEKALRVLKPEGGVLHFHCLCRKDRIPQMAWQPLRRSIEELGRRAELAGTVKVKSFKPKVWHIVLEVRVL